MLCTDFELIEDAGKTITLGLKDTDTTLINPIMDMLDRNEDVKIVRYINIHPELEEPQLVVEVKEEAPVSAREVLIDAANKVSEYYGTVNQ